MYWIYFFFRLLSEAWGNQLPGPGLNSCILYWEHGVLNLREYSRQVVGLFFSAMFSQPHVHEKGEGEKTQSSNANSKLSDAETLCFAFYLVSMGLL